jgi:hypothetical protein
MMDRRLDVTFLGVGMTLNADSYADAITGSVTDGTPRSS